MDVTMTKQRTVIERLSVLGPFSPDLHSLRLWPPGLVVWFAEAEMASVVSFWDSLRALFPVSFEFTVMVWVSDIITCHARLTRHFTSSCSSSGEAPDDPFRATD